MPRRAAAYPVCPNYGVPCWPWCRDGIGITPTSPNSLAMMPAASVSGFYLAHPPGTYFNVGKIGEDQLADMVKRRAMEMGDRQGW